MAGADGRREEGVLITLKEHLLRLMEDYRNVADREHKMLALHIDDVEKRLVLMHESEVERIETLLDAEEKAWGLFRSEVGQRLDSLNHNQDKIEHIQQTYVPREVYEKRTTAVDEKVGQCLPRAVFDLAQQHGQEDQKDLRGFQDRVNEALARMAERRTVLASITISALALLGTIASIITQAMLSSHR